MSASTLSPMYCGLDLIAGLEREKARAERLLERYFPDGEAGLVVLGVDDPDFVYVQANFVYQEDHRRPFKFVDRFATLAANRALEIVGAAGGATGILFVDRALKARFEQHPAFALVVPQFRLAADFPAAAPEGGLFGGLRRAAAALSGGGEGDGRQRSSRSENPVKALKIYTKAIRTTSSLKELFTLGFAFLHYGSLDLFPSAIEQRVQANPRDGLARTALAAVLIDFGDWARGLEAARLATTLPDQPPEAWLWAAKGEWLAGRTQAALEALEGCRAPTIWPREVRMRALALRAVVMASAGLREGALAATVAALEVEGALLGLHLLKARLLAELGQVEAAREALEDARVIDPASVLVEVELCRLFARSGEAAELTTALERLQRRPQGAFEADRFLPAAQEGRPGLGESYAEIDELRGRAVDWSLLPAWHHFGEGNTFATMMRLTTDDDHRGESDYGKGFTPTLDRLMRRPLDPAAFLSMGSIWLQLERPTLAEAWLAAGVGLDPTNLAGHQVLAFAQGRAGRFEDATHSVDRALRLGLEKAALQALKIELIFDPPLLDVLEAMAPLDGGKEALERLAAARLDVPELRAGALAAQAIARRSSSAKAAVELFRQALLLRPDHLDLWFALAGCCRAAGDAAGEAKALQEAAQRLLVAHPDHSAGRFRSLADEHAGDDLRQRAYLLAALARDPSHLGAQVALAALDLGGPDPGGAVARLRAHAQRRDGAAVEAAVALAAHAETQEDYEEALASWTRAAELDPGHPLAGFGRASALWLLDRDDEAAVVAAATAAAHPDNGWGLGLTGRIHAWIQRFPEAADFFSRALEVDPALTDLRLPLVRALLAAGQPDAAIATSASWAEPLGLEEAVARVEAMAANDERGGALKAAQTWLSGSCASAEDAVALRETVQLQLGLAAALEFGEACLSRWPNDIELAGECALALNAAGRFHAGYALANRPLETESHAWLLRVAAILLANLNPSAAEATRLAQRMLSADPDEITAHLRAADLRRAAGLPFRKAYAQALQRLRDTGVEDHPSEGWCLLHLGEFPAAVEKLSINLAGESDGAQTRAARVELALATCLAHPGPQSSEQLTEQLRRARFEDPAAGQGAVAQAAGLVGQWLAGGLAPEATLVQMREAVQRAREAY